MLNTHAYSPSLVVNTALIKRQYSIRLIHLVGASEDCQSLNTDVLTPCFLFVQGVAYYESFSVLSGQYDNVFMCFHVVIIVSQHNLVEVDDVDTGNITHFGTTEFYQDIPEKTNRSRGQIFVKNEI